MSDKIKVIFLDIDGVLHLSTAKKDLELDSDCVARLKRVIDETGAVVVMSSSWRLIPNLRHQFTCKTEIKLYDITPNCPGIRGQEIKTWIDAETEFGKVIEQYVIVDDDSDMLDEQLPFFVQTGWTTGLTEHAAQRMIDILVSDSSVD